MRNSNTRLWIAQSLLAVLFLFAGTMKLIVPIDELVAQAHFPALFLRFIAVAEILGALGLVLPGLFRIHRQLTPLAGAGLAIIMTGATITTAVRGPVAGAAVPFVVGLLALYVARGRSSQRVQRPSSRRQDIRTAR